MAVAINTTLPKADQSNGTAGSGTTYSGLVVPASLANVAYLFFVHINITSGSNVAGLSASGITGLTSLGTITSGTLISGAWAALLGAAPAGSTPTITLSWTGAGTGDIYTVALALTGVDQTAVATSFTNFATFGPTTGTNPALTIASKTNGYCFAAFSTIGTGDFTAITNTTFSNDNQLSINWRGGAAAGTGSNITFTTTEGTSQLNIGFVFNVVPVGGVSGTVWGWEPILGRLERARWTPHRVAATLVGPILAPQPPGNLLPAPLGGYEFTSPPLLSRQRVQVAAQVATGLSLSPSQASDLRPPVYGYELTSPAIVRNLQKPDFPVPLRRLDTDIAPQYGHEAVILPLVRSRLKPDLPVPLSRQDADVPTQYGYELTSPPLVRSRLKPDLPYPLNRQDTDVSTQYGYETVTPPLVRVRKKPDLPVPLGRLDSDTPTQYGYEAVVTPLVRSRLKPDLPTPLVRQDTDAAAVYGYDSTSPPLVRGRRVPPLPDLAGRLDTDIVITGAALLSGFDFAQQGPPRKALRWAAALAGLSLVPADDTDIQPWATWGWPVLPDLPVRRKPDLPVQLGRLDSDSTPQYGHEPVIHPLVRNRRKPDLPIPLSRLDSDPAPQYGHEAVILPLVRVRVKPDLPVPFWRLDADVATQYGYDLTSVPLTRARLRPDLPVPLNRQDTDIFIPPAALLNGWDMALYTPPRLTVARGGAALAGISLIIGPPTDLLRPIYGYELTSPPLVVRSRARVAAMVATGLSLSSSQASDLRPTLYGYELFPPLPLQQPRGLRGAILAGMALPPTQDSGLVVPVYGYELTSPPLLTRVRSQVVGSGAFAGLSLITSPLSDLRWTSWGWAESWVERKPPHLTDYPAWPASPLLVPPPALAQYGWEFVSPAQLRPRRWPLPDLPSVFWIPLHGFVSPGPSIEEPLGALLEAQTTFLFTAGTGLPFVRAAFAVRVATQEDLPLDITDQHLLAPLLAAPEHRRDLPPDTGPAEWNAVLVGAFVFDFSQTIDSEDEIIFAFITRGSEIPIVASPVTTSPVSGIHRQAVWCPMDVTVNNYQCTILTLFGQTRSSTIYAAGYGRFRIGLQPIQIAGDGQFYLVV